MIKRQFMNIRILFLSLFLLISLYAKAQTFQPGYYYDTTGVKHVGLVRVSTLDNGAAYGTSKIIGTEVFNFKINADAQKQEVYAYDVKSVVTGIDSFVVQRTFIIKNNGEVKKDDNGNPYKHAAFFQVQLDHSDFKIYSKEQFGNSTFNNGFSLQSPNRIEYYYGKVIDNIEPFTNDNFVDFMSYIMNDSPDIVAKIKNKEFKLRKMDKLLKAYKIEKGIPIPKEATN
jgi:hypothetical protein